MMAHPSDEALKHLVSSTNAVSNLDITVPAISNARDLFGPDLGAVRGKPFDRDQVQYDQSMSMSRRICTNVSKM